MMAPYPDVELRDIRTFLLVAEELHFGRAAVRLGVSPSRASQTVRLLERRIGSSLFTRTSRTVRLTEDGARLLASVRPPYELLQQALRAAREAADGITGTLRIGMYTESLAGPHMVEIITVFEARHPGAEAVLVNTGLNRNYLDALRAGDVDLVAARLPVSDPDIIVGPVLTSEDRVLLVARTNPLARRESVLLDDLAGLTLSIAPALPREMLDELIPPSTPSGHCFRRAENSSIEEMLMRIATGKQAHLTTPSFLEYHAHPAIAGVPVAGLPQSRTALAWLTAGKSPAVRAFAEEVAHFLNDSPGR
jgi:DNA-binding transcriptional LysR family regulator